MCYSQCAAYKFVWQGDYCYDMFQQNCAMGSGPTIKETIKFLKAVACRPMIEGADGAGFPDRDLMTFAELGRGIAVVLKDFGDTGR